MAGDLTAVPGIRVGHATDPVGLTGCTVVLCEAGAVVGVDVRGSAPGTRETDLCRPGMLVERANAVLLAGGSAYGLDAAAGVMRWLEERGAGFDVGLGVVPIVPGAVIFDLALGSFRARPDAAMGYAACEAAGAGPLAQGCVGAGTGASVGKLFGPQFATKSGLGSAAVTLPGGVVVAALVVCNAIGDIVHSNADRILAGARSPQGGWRRTAEAALTGHDSTDPYSDGRNTTIGVVATNARLTKEQANKLAQVGHDGLARAINPVHLPGDGDTLFALSLGETDAALPLLCIAAARAVEAATHRAALEASAAGGLPCGTDLAGPA